MLLHPGGAEDPFISTIESEDDGYLRVYPSDKKLVSCLASGYKAHPYLPGLLAIPWVRLYGFVHTNGRRFAWVLLLGLNS